MLHAMFLAVTLAGAPEPTRLDYDRGVAVAAAEKKPVAVFVGDWADRVLDDDVRRVLADCYVTVRVDVNTPAGRVLADRLEVTRGLVVSSAGGAHQAFSLSGTMGRSELVETLAKFCDPDFKFSTTQVVVREAFRPRVVQYLPPPPVYYYSSGST